MYMADICAFDMQGHLTVANGRRRLRENDCIRSVRWLLVGFNKKKHIYVRHVTAHIKICGEFVQTTACD
jgi:hypothetical protein